MRSLFVLCLALLLGCGSAEDSSTVLLGAPLLALPHSDGQVTAALSPMTAGPLDGRPYQYKVPSRYDKTKPTPLVIMLHGFSASGSIEELYLNIGTLAEQKTFLYAFPDGTQNPVGLRFWNAMEWCCNFFKSGVDVGKAELLVAKQPSDKQQPIGEKLRLPNTDSAIVKWLRTLPPGSPIAMESTGRYHQRLALLAIQAGMKVYVLNARDVHFYSKALGMRGKTDPSEFTQWNFKLFGTVEPAWGLRITLDLAP